MRSGNAPPGHRIGAGSAEGTGAKTAPVFFSVSIPTPETAANRDAFTLAPDGFVQVAKIGDWHKRTGDDEDDYIVQRVDHAGCEAMLARFKRDAEAPSYPGLLIDYDHFSHDPDKPTIAAGWIEEIQLREDGLWARPRWSDSGKADVVSGRYRCISPVFGDMEVVEDNPRLLRPRQLVRVALTNDPNMRWMAPVTMPNQFSNRDKSGVADGKSNAARNRDNAMDYKAKLCGLLGLAPDASDADIEAKIAGMAGAENMCKTEMNRAKDEANRLRTENAGLRSELDKVQANRVAEALTRFKDTIPADKVEVWKNRLTSSYDMTVEALTEIAAAKPQRGAPPKPIHNRQQSSHPGSPTATPDELTQEQQVIINRIGVRARELMTNRERRLTTAQAFRAAMDEALATGKVTTEQLMGAAPEEN